MSGAALPLGATLPACTDDPAPPLYDAGIAVDAGIVADVGSSGGVDVYRPPADADVADASDASDPAYDVTGGPLMPPEFGEDLA